MLKPCEGVMPVADGSLGQTIGELLLFIGDAGKGLKFEAMDQILKMDLELVYPFLESAVRDDQDADLRNGAMEVLVSRGKEVVPQLIQLLQDANEEVRNFSAVMLGDIGNRDAVAPLIRALQDPDANVRHGAAESLGKIGDSGALAPLMELLKEDFWLQYPAIVALGEMGDKRAVPHLLTLLDQEMLSGPIVEALGKIGDTRALQTLCTMLNTSGDTVAAGTAARAIVTMCLNQHPDPDSLSHRLYELKLQHLVDAKGTLKLKQLLHEGDCRETVCAAILLLGWLQEATALPDIYELAHHADYFEAIEQSIPFMGKRAIPYSIAALSLPAVRVKILAARAIAVFGDDSDVGKLVPLLSDESEEVLKQILELLKGHNDDDLLPRLFDLVESGGKEISLLASEVLGGYHSSKFHELLQRLARSADPAARERAAILIRSDGRNSNLEILSRLAEDEVAAVRKAVVRTLGCKKLPAGNELLRRALGDFDENVRIEAVLSMAESGADASVEELLDLLPFASEEIVCAVAGAVARTGAEAGGEALLKLLGERPVSQRVEFVILETFAALGYKPACPILAHAYLKHHDLDFRRLAVKALGSIGDADSLEAIGVCCKDAHWSVRISALQALLKVGGEAALPALFVALSDPDYMVRKTMIATLRESGYPQAIPKLVEQLNDPEMGRHALEELLKVGRRGLLSLHRMLRNEKSVETRVRLIDIIGRIGDRMSIGVLKEVLEDPAASIRLAAIDALLFCFDGSLLKKLSHLKSFDPCIEVKDKADLALRTLTMEKFF